MESIKSESNLEPMKESQPLVGTEPENGIQLASIDKIVHPKSEALERAEATFKSIMGTFSNEADVTKFIKYMDSMFKEHGISIFGLIFSFQELISI